MLSIVFSFYIYILIRLLLSLIPVRILHGRHLPTEEDWAKYSQDRISSLSASFLGVVRFFFCSS